MEGWCDMYIWILFSHKKNAILSIAAEYLELENTVLSEK